MLTARDIAARFGVPLRSAQRLLSRWHRAGHATRVLTGGRPALAVAEDALATLGGVCG